MDRLTKGATVGPTRSEEGAPGGWRERVARSLGPVGAPQPLGGRSWRLPTAHGDVVVKTGPGAIDEAEGLAELGRGEGAPPVPEVLLAEPGLLVTRWVEQGPRTRAHDEALGQTLAALHAQGWPHFGGGSSWIGDCPVDPAVCRDGEAFYGSRLSELAARCELEHQIRPVLDRIGRMLPPDGPALVHGDLWWGNVLWGADGRPWLIDPSAHGGYPEEDLTMLGLFGSVPDATARAYAEERPPAAGWEERVDLFRLYPLLVHAVLFGGDYRAEAEAVIRRLT